MVFENGVKNIQAAAYNDARTVEENGQPIYANFFQIFIVFSDFSKYFYFWNKLIIKIVLIGHLENHVSIIN